MKKTFEHLLGLSAKDALALLKSSGIFDVRVTLTHAPPKLLSQKQGTQPTQNVDKPRTTTLYVADEDYTPDPLLEPVMDDGMLIEARVIGVRDDGRQLLVSNFRVGDPKPPEGNTP